MSWKTKCFFLKYMHYRYKDKRKKSNVSWFWHWVTTLSTTVLTPRVSTAQLLSTSVLALKYEYELNCQEKSKFCKFISKRGIISLRHSSILRKIWLNFMALCLVFIRRLFQFSHFFFGFPTFLTWASLKRLE
jgi:hypothetical protein